MKCVAEVERREAANFHFGETVTADWKIDGTSVYRVILKEDNANKINQNNTYIFKNVVLCQDKAYFNSSTSAYRSYDLPVSAEVTAKCTDLLYPPSTVTKMAHAKTVRGYSTLCGKVSSLSLPRRVASGGRDVPLLDLELTAEGESVNTGLWREAALAPLKMGEWIEFTHLKGAQSTAFGYKLNSTIYTVITPIDLTPCGVACEIEGFLEGEAFHALLLKTGVEVQVPVPEFKGSVGDFVHRLPLQVTLQIQGDQVMNTSELFNMSVS